MANEKQKRYSRKKSDEVADIGVIPAVVDPERKASCEFDLEKFLVIYFPASTGLSPFSDDHKRVIKRLQQCILEGGRFVNAVYRGFAKTTISENASIWATLYGHRKYIPIFGADANSAGGNIDSIKLELSENELLMEDFPEVCHPIRALEGKPQRCASQVHRPGNVEGNDIGSDVAGELTHIEWTSSTIVLPTVRLPDGQSPASGAIITARGLTAGSRGMKHKRPDGTQQRPDFVLIDDPQTDESAGSALQVGKRLGVIKKSILKLGGHQKQIAVIMNATVIELDDLVDQLLDSKRNPSWQGERIPMVRKWPDAHETLWLTDYANLRKTYDPDAPGSQKLAHQRATEFYKKNRAAMDAGGVVSWKHCFDKETEISALQHAYNFLIDDGEDVFASECQNQPRPPAESPLEMKASAIMGKAMGLARGIVPLACSHITAFVDVQATALPWMVCGWGEGFTGSVLDYDMFPELGRAGVFGLKDIRKTLAKAFPGMGRDGAILAGLKMLVDELVGREWKREDGTIMKLSRVAIDAGWGDTAELVYKFCRQCGATPAKGKYIGAASMPFDEYKKKEGEQLGHHWLVAPVPKHAVRLLHVDVNYWKSFVFNRLQTADGDPGALTLFGKPEQHQLLAAHLRSEFCVQTQGRGRTVNEWKLRPGAENHYLDCLVGCAVGASILGVATVGKSKPRAKKKSTRSKVSYL